MGPRYSQNTHTHEGNEQQNVGNLQIVEQIQKNLFTSAAEYHTLKR